MNAPEDPMVIDFRSPFEESVPLSPLIDLRIIWRLLIVCGRDFECAVVSESRFEEGLDSAPSVEVFCCAEDKLRVEIVCINSSMGVISRVG